MADGLAAFAEFSNLCSICTIIICFIIMVIFILRLRSDQISNTPVTQPGLHIPVTRMIAIQNPFVFTLSSDEQGSLWYVLNSQVPCQVYTFWGVSITALFGEMGKSWTLFKERLSNNRFLIGSCFFKESAFDFDGNSQKQFQLKPPNSFKSCDLGPMPRSKYPVVIIIVNSFESDETLQSAEIVALINIVHIADSLCPLPSSIHEQYLKRTDSWVCPLKCLFMAAENSTNNDDVRSSTSVIYKQNEENDKKDCVVCQNAAVSCVLLPCRHTCVCDNCFTYLDKCPICRGYIYSYFSIEHMADNHDEENLQESLNFFTRLQQWNERLNRCLGFHQNV